MLLNLTNLFNKVKTHFTRFINITIYYITLFNNFSVLIGAILYPLLLKILHIISVCNLSLLSLEFLNFSILNCSADNSFSPLSISVELFSNLRCVCANNSILFNEFFNISSAGTRTAWGRRRPARDHAFNAYRRVPSPPPGTTPAPDEDVFTSTVWGWW